MNLVVEPVRKLRGYPGLLLSLIMAGVLILAFTQNLHTQEEITRPGPTESSGEEPTLYLPLITVPLNTPFLNPIGRPNSSNQWTITWHSDNGGAATYELQESYDPDFATINNSYLLGTEKSYLVTQTPGWRNHFYYRVRAMADGKVTPWSNVRSVIGGYRDDFDDPSSGWAIRRTTFIDEVRSWYENGWFILQVEDSWDWGIASPMNQAPELPYAIEFRSQPAHLANLVSHGAVFGGDWPGAICPDYSTIQGVYQHNLCFNHFYNSNIIWFGPLKMAFERVDYLVWCPGCGGSPMKRLSHDYGAWFIRDPVPNVSNPDGWNIWRIEVRNTGLDFFVNGQHFAHSDDTTWVNDRYFGVFASTDEYSNSTWRFDYYEVLALDN
jgi:hypothetical protein